MHIVDHCIELEVGLQPSARVPGLQPSVRVPYELSRVNLEELQIQINELLDARFK